MIELKRPDSNETPVRILIEALANAVAVKENWPALSLDDDFRRLRGTVEAAGYPVRLVTFDWPFDGDPRIRRADVDW